MIGIKSNIKLPEMPIHDNKIIKLVCTNIFDFSTLIYDGVRIVDESTLLKFFLNPAIEVIYVNNKKVLNNKKIWKGNAPTVQEFLEYLENPVTISPYNDCFKSHVKAFERFEGDYPVAIFDEILVKDPYAKVINEALKQNLANEKVGRNDPCPCGSGKKYKKCCGS